MNQTFEFLCNEYMNNKTQIANAIEKERRNIKENADWFVLIFLVSSTIIFCFIEAACETYAHNKSILVGPVTTIPFIPFSQKGFQEFKGNEKLKNRIPEARIQCGSKFWDIRKVFHGEHKSAIWKMDSIMKMVFELEEIKDRIVPEDARLISIKMDNFKHGFRCHEFEPIDGKAPGSYYTYQMFGDNRIQVTSYVEDGITYIAGFCIYIENPWIRGTQFPVHVVEWCINHFIYPGMYPRDAKEDHQIENDEESSGDKETIWSWDHGSSNVSMEKYPIYEQISHPNEVPTEELTIRFCQRLQRKIMSSLKSGIVFHQEWDKYEKKMINEECQMCSESLSNESPPAYSSLSIV